MVEVCGPLSARPPTPPRTSRPLTERGQAENSPVVAQTPRDSPFAAGLLGGASSSRQSKRVNFSPCPNIILPPSFTNPTTTTDPELKTLPPSNECKPTRSILKATSSPAPANSTVVNHTPESFVMLLESVTQQLAGDSLSGRLDAYMQFFGALRTYENLPAGKDMVNRLGKITQFIQRDVGKGFENGEPLQNNVVIQALKLANTLLWTSEVAPHLPDDFKVFVVDLAINGLQDPAATKSVVVHYLSILSAQNVHSKIMVNARLTRLLPALINITNRVGGNGIIGQRLTLYSRILSHSKTIFLPHAPRWMEHLVTGCLHHLKDIRVKAISLGFQLSTAFGPNVILSKSICDLFNRNIDKGRKLAAEICERMLRMMADPDSGTHVPQVWSVMLLLLRNKRASIDHWEHFREFVLVLQRCFNCSDNHVKAQAIIAWNRFVFVTTSGETTNLAVVRMLGKPLMSQFERKRNDKQGPQQPGALVWYSYHNLLYYAFPPSSTYQHLDLVWDEYIAQPSAIANPVPTLSNRLAYALSNMLWSTQAKVWTANRANETHKLTAEELPTLDPKWIRSRITRVLKVFEGIFRTSVWANEIEKSKIAAAWVSLARALSSASSKEITTSPDSMQAVAHVLGLLQRLWKAGPAAINAAQNNSMDKFFARFRFLSSTMILALGNIQFTEKLFLKTSDETFQAANTPTHRHAQASSHVESPILHLLRLISTVPGALEPTPAYFDLVNHTLQVACKGRNSRGSRLELLRQCAELYPDAASDASSPYNFARIVWKSTAQLAADTLCSYPIESARVRDGSASRDYESTVRILTSGLKFSGPTQEWSKLVDSLVRVVRNEKGDGEIATTVIEPLAENMMGLRVQNICLPVSSLLNHSLSISYSHHDVTGGERMESASITHPRNEKSASPIKLVNLMNRILRESYEQFHPTENTAIADYIESLTSFLGSGAQPFRTATLEHLQQSLALWIKDEPRKINLESGVESRILTACRALSSAVVNILQVSSPHDLDLLTKQESIICSGIESSHMSVAKRFVDYCNSTFGTQESIKFPERVSRALEAFESRITLQKSQQDQAKNDPIETSKSTETGPDMGEKSRIAFILDHSVDDAGPEVVDSSPITKESAALPLSLEPLNNSQTNSPAIDDTPDQAGNGGAQVPLPTVVGEPRRSDVFSMIDNLRSSSPARTPREFGFMTPPHLRNLRNPDRETGTPQTPTLPPVTIDNEDGFLGSSPTPSTRGRTPAVRSGLPQSWTTSADGPVDPPSSPPDVESQSRKFDSAPAALDTSTPQSRSSSKKKSKRSSAKKKNKKAQSSQEGHLDSSNDTSRAGTPLISRLRSSGGKAPTAEPSPQPQNTSLSSSKKLSSSKPSKKNKSPFGSFGGIEQSSFAVQSTIADSFSDEETQLASQLEQDLESAVDSFAKSSSQKTQKAQSQPPVTRKRKREVDEFSTPTNKERRRSSRFSNNESNEVEVPAAAEPEVTKSTRSTRSKKQTSTAEQSVVYSPVESVPKKKRRHPNNDTNNVEELKAAPMGQPVDSTPTEPVSKRRRQSKGDINDVEVPKPADDVQPVASPAEPAPKRLRQSKRLSNHVEEPQTPHIEQETGETEKILESQDTGNPQKQELPHAVVEQPSGESQNSPQPSETSSSQKRRSSRLSGHTSPAVAEELPAPTRPSSSRSRKQAAKLQEVPEVAEPDTTVSETIGQPVENSQPADEEPSIGLSQTGELGETQNPIEQAMEMQVDTQTSEQETHPEPTNTDIPMIDAIESVDTPATVPTSQVQTVDKTEEQPQQTKGRSSRSKKQAKGRQSSRIKQTAAVSPVPEAASVPEALTVPEIVTAPEPVITPETVTAPEAFVAPEPDNAPETAATPEIVAAPETTAVPETVDVPESIAVPETTAAPDVPKPTEESDIISNLKKALEDAKSAVLDLDGLRQVDDLLFDIRLHAHEALTKNRD